MNFENRYTQCDFFHKGKHFFRIFKEDRLCFGKMQINLLMRSACTIFQEDRLRFGKMQINLLLRSACTIFANSKNQF